MSSLGDVGRGDVSVKEVVLAAKRAFRDAKTSVNKLTLVTGSVSKNGNGKQHGKNRLSAIPVKPKRHSLRGAKGRYVKANAE